MTFCHSKLKVIIPARGGSKGVPRKNVKLLKGLPLIAYPILAAKKCKNVSDIYVSTDNDEIAETAKGYGATIIDRPPQYATDTALDIDVMRHAVKFLNDSGDIVHLRATTPMIESEVIDSAIKYFFENVECTALRSAHECPETAFKFFKKSNIFWEGLFNDKFDGDYYNQPRQTLPKTFQPNGYVDIVRPHWFMRNNSLHGNKMLAFETSYVHEVDTLNDFKILEAINDKN